MITQAWVDKIMAAADKGDEPTVIGRSEDDDKIDAWTLRYISRFVEVGVPLHFALETYKSGCSDHDYTSDPIQAADDEMSYWTDDGGET